MALRIAQQTLQREDHKHTSEMTGQPLQKAKILENHNSI